jgi:hypothetical protein
MSTTGLRRFVGSSGERRPSSGPAPAERTQTERTQTDRTQTDRTQTDRTQALVERCELCGNPCGPEGTVARPGHGHVADLEHRSIRCVCRPCYLLFTQRGAAGGRYHSVPERFVHVPEPELTPAQWDTLQIPVRIAFLFRSSGLGDSGPDEAGAGEWVAFYPSPAGATQSLLALDSWTDVVAANPVFATAEPDVEAVLVQRSGTGFEAFVVPISACYELVARVRMHWQGFDGGEAVHAQIDGFFTALRERTGTAHE